MKKNNDFSTKVDVEVQFMTNERSWLCTNRSKKLQDCKFDYIRVAFVSDSLGFNFNWSQKRITIDVHCPGSTEDTTTAAATTEFCASTVTSSKQNQYPQTSPEGLVG